MEQAQDDARDVTVAGPAVKQPLKLIEKFSASMGGIEPEKMITILKATAFRLPDKNFGGQWEHQEVSMEQMGALLMVAHTYGLNPFLKEIYAFPDKGGIVPIIGVDGWSRMINDHKDMDGMKFEFDERVETYDHAKPCPISCTCIIYRKGRSHPIEVTEYLDEVYRPPFKPDKPGPWQSHTKRMLRHKAMIQCARLAFGFTGIHDQDEAERIVEGEYIPADDTPTKSESLTSRFGTDKVISAGGEPIVILPEDAPTIEPEKKPESPKAEKPKAKNKASKVTPKKSEEKKPKPVGVDYISKIVAAETQDQVMNVLNDAAEDKKLTHAKRLVIKKAAGARMVEVTPA